MYKCLLTYLSLYIVSCVLYNDKERPPVFAGLTFSLQQGINVLVTGASGCGKSSLLRVINGIWPELRGEPQLCFLLVEFSVELIIYFLYVEGKIFS